MRVILFFAFIFFVCCNKQNESSFVQFANLNKTDVGLAKRQLLDFKKENRFFKLMLDDIKLTGKTILIKFEPKEKLAGFFPSISSHFEIRFRSLSEFMDKNILFEEIFHIYQYQFYGYKKMRPDKNGIINGAPNIEYEARLLKAIIAFNTDRAFAETPSQKGLINFVMKLIDKNGKISLTALDTKRHKEYIELVKHFQQHWKTRNAVENKNSLYDHPVDTLLGPNACLHLLKCYNLSRVVR